MPLKSQITQINVESMLHKIAWESQEEKKEGEERGSF
jgi:hypothetical protein